MPYGILKVDTITFTNDGIDQSINISGIVASISGNLTATGTISGNVIRGGTTVSGATVTGSTGQFGNLTSVSGTFTTISGGTYTLTSGVFASGTAANPSISFVSDPNTGIYSPGADQVAISTSGVERVEFGTSEVVFNDGNNNYDFRIESDNNANLFFVDASVDRLGIGHGSPATLVHIADTLAGSPVTTRIENFSSSANSDAVIELKTPNETYGLKANRSGARLDLDIGGTPKISITAGGLVGLGTSSPAGTLHVNGQTYIQGAVSGGNANSTLIGNNSGQAQIWALGADTSTTGSMTFVVARSNLTSSAQAITIDSSARVGIGTTSPAQALDVNGNVQISGSTPRLLANMSGTQSSRFAIQNSTTNGNTRFFLYPNGTGNISAINGINNSDPNASDYQAFDLAVIGTTDVRLSSSKSGSGSFLPITFYTSDTERARIDSSGRLLVGTSTGNYQITTEALTYNAGKIGILTIGRSGAEYPSAGYNVRFGSSVGVYTYDNTDTAAMIRYGQNGGRIETYTAALGTGGASISFSTGPYVAQGGTSWTSSSDERLKEDLVPIENALEKTSTLRAVTGRFKTDAPEKRRPFLLAQDVKAVLPEAVDDTVPDSLGLDYSGLIPLLVAALKESKERIEALEAEVAALKSA